MSEGNQSCRNCRYWRPFYDRATEHEGPGGQTGECRRYPPWVTHTDVEPYGGIPFERGEHVCTDAHTWCGEWRAAGPQTADGDATALARAVLAGAATAGRALADRLIELIVLPTPPAEPPPDRARR